MSNPKSNIQPWHIYTALALLSSIAGAGPLVVLFTFLAVMAGLARLTSF